MAKRSRRLALLLLPAVAFGPHVVGQHALHVDPPPLLRVPQHDLEFFSMPAYTAWAEAHPELARTARTKYYKGLGTSTASDGKRYFAHPDRYLVRMTGAAAAREELEQERALAREVARVERQDAERRAAQRQEEEEYEAHSLMERIARARGLEVEFER